MDKRYESLKAHAEAKLDNANIEIAKARAAYEKEIAALKTKISRFELNIASLETSLATKEHENQELTKICDGLVQQMETLQC
jgi:transforming acidic coiled-coil-containing protein 3